MQAVVVQRVLPHFELADWANADQLPVAAVIGAGGAGKSVLAAQIEAVRARAGLVTLRCAGHRLEQHEAFGVFDHVIDLAGAGEEREVRRRLLARLGPSGLLVLDDAQWADPPSLGVVVGLLERAESAGVGVVVLHRPAAEHRTLAVVDELAARRRPPIRVGPFGEAELAEWCARALGAAVSPGLVEVLARRSAGVPLLADRLLAGWAAEGMVENGRLGEAAAGHVPGAVLDLVASRAGQLGDVERWVLTALALDAGLDDALALFAGDDPAAAGRAQAALEAEGLLLPGGRQPPLVAEAVALLAPSADRRRYHLTVARRLASRGADPVAVAEHVLAAGETGAEAASAFLAAGDRVRAESAERARWWYRHAQVGGGGPALDARLAEAAALCGDDAEALAAADRAVRSSVGADRSRALAAQAAVLARRGLWGRAARAYQLVDEHPLEPKELFGFCAAVCLVRAGDLAGARALDAAARADLSAHAPLAVEAMGVVSAALLASVERAAPLSLRELAEGAALFESAPLGPPVGVLPHEIAASLASAAGEFSVAERLASRALEQGLGGPLFTRRLELLAGWAAMRRGDRGRAQDALAAAADPALASAPHDDVLRVGLAAALARRAGDVAELGLVADEAARLLPHVPPDLLLVEPLGELTIVVNRFGHGVRLGGLHRQVRELLAELGDPPLWALPHRWSELEAQIAVKSLDAIGPLAEEVVALARRSGRLGCLGPAATIWRSILAGSVDVAAIDEAVAALAAVELNWEASQLAGQAAIRSGDAQVAKALLGQARLLKGSRSAEAGAPLNESALSDRELEVAQYIIDGLTYKEIGALLYISPKTVEHHVAKIRQKVGAVTRAELLAALRDELSVRAAS